MNKKILFLVLLSILISPSFASAAWLSSITCVSTGNIIIDMACNAAGTALAAAGYIVIGLWIFTGVLFLLAQGAPEKLNGARKAMMTSIIGTILVILANFAIALVGGVFGL